MKKHGFPTLRDMKVPKGGLLSPKLRRGFGSLDLGKIKKSVLK